MAALSGFHGIRVTTASASANPTQSQGRPRRARPYSTCRGSNSSQAIDSRANRSAKRLTRPSRRNRTLARIGSIVGAALRGRPFWFPWDSSNDGLGFGEPDSIPRAATEGRPYSTCRGSNSSQAIDSRANRSAKRLTRLSRRNRTLARMGSIVGAALCGRPFWFPWDSSNDGLGFREHDSIPRAAAEGRPYSTCRGSKGIIGFGLLLFWKES